MFLCKRQRDKRENKEEGGGIEKVEGWIRKRDLEEKL